MDEIKLSGNMSATLFSSSSSNANANPNLNANTGREVVTGSQEGTIWRCATDVTAQLEAYTFERRAIRRQQISEVRDVDYCVFIGIGIGIGIEGGLLNWCFDVVDVV